MHPRLFQAAALCGVLVVGAVAHVCRGAAFEHHRTSQKYEDVYYLPSNSALVMLSMGHREAMADLLWIRTLIYFGDELVHRGDKENLLRYAEAMLTLDVYFKRVYRWIGTVALYRKGTPSKEDMLTAVEYLERGVKLFPDDGQLAWSLGATYAYELVQKAKTDEERDALRQKGHEHIRVAVIRGAAPPRLAATTARYFAKAGRKAEALRHLREVYAMVNDPGDREQLEVQMRKLEGEAFMEEVRAHERAFRERWMGQYPYLDPALFALVGDRMLDDDIAQLQASFDPSAALTVDSPADGALLDAVDDP